MAQYHGSNQDTFHVEGELTVEWDEEGAPASVQISAVTEPEDNSSVNDEQIVSNSVNESDSRRCPASNVTNINKGPKSLASSGRSRNRISRSRLAPTSTLTKLTRSKSRSRSSNQYLLRQKSVSILRTLRGSRSSNRRIAKVLQARSHNPEVHSGSRSRHITGSSRSSLSAARRSRSRSMERRGSGSGRRKKFAGSSGIQSRNRTRSLEGRGKKRRRSSGRSGSRNKGDIPSQKSIRSNAGSHSKRGNKAKTSASKSRSRNRSRSKSRKRVRRASKATASASKSRSRSRSKSRPSKGTTSASKSRSRSKSKGGSKSNSSIRSPNKSSSKLSRGKAKRQSRKGGRKSSSRRGSIQKKKRRGVRRPRNEYIFFAMTRRPEIVASNPHLAFGHIGRLLGREWRALSDHDRQPYLKQAQKDRIRYINARNARQKK